MLLALLSVPLDRTVKQALIVDAVLLLREGGERSWLGCCVAPAYNGGVQVRALVTSIKQALIVDALRLVRHSNVYGSLYKLPSTPHKEHPPVIHLMDHLRAHGCCT